MSSRLKANELLLKKGRNYINFCEAVAAYIVTIRVAPLSGKWTRKQNQNARH